MEGREITYWCDSTTVLFWIQRNGPWAPFVENRVKEIRSLTKVNSWKHVPGDQNPADLPSRGCDLSTLIKVNWWDGPDWLKRSSSEWPMSNHTYHESEIRNEIRKTAVLKAPLSEMKIMSVISNVSHDVKVEPFYIPKTSKFNTIGAFAWLNRFINYVRWPGRERKGGSLTLEERKNAEKTVLRISQRDSFDGIDDVKLRTMNALLTDDGLIRTQSKILQRDDVYSSFRYPVILLGENPVTRLLIIETHERLGHSNVNAILSYLREEYWIIHGRNKTTLMSAMSAFHGMEIRFIRTRDPEFSTGAESISSILLCVLDGRGSHMLSIAKI